MTSRSRVPGLVVLIALLTQAPGVAAPAAAQVAPLTQPAPADMEAFLRDGVIVRTRNAGKGVTNSKRVTMTLGSLTHDVQVQTVDIARTTFEAGKATELDFKDTYRYNIAGYRVATLLGVRVPMSIERRFENKDAAFTWWVDDVATDESGRLKSKERGSPLRVSRQLTVMRVFDELVQNRDRNQGNMLWTSDWTLWLIDHTRAFRTGRDLVKPDNLKQVDRGLLARLRVLDRATLVRTVGTSLNGREIDAVLARRDKLLQHYDALIARAGEANVLFDLE